MSFQESKLTSSDTGIGGEPHVIISESEGGKELEMQRDNVHNNQLD